MGTYTSAAYEEDGIDLAEAWPRFWARLFDIAIYSLPVALVVGMAFPSLVAGLTSDPKVSNYLLGMLLLPIVMVLDAVVISQLGSSPGKAIAGLYVARTDQEKLTIEAALKRNMLLYVRGLLFGLPLLCLIGYSNGYSAVRDEGHTSWDRDTDSRVFSSGNNPARTVLIGALAILAFAFSSALDKM